MERLVDLLAVALLAYLALGALFAPAFAFRFAPRLDPAARGGSLAFKLLLLPGAIALWPTLALRVAGRAQTDRNAPQRVASGMARLRRRHLGTFVALLVALPFAVPLARAAHREARVNATLPPDPRGPRAPVAAAGASPMAWQEVAALGGGRFLCAAGPDGLTLRQDAADLPDVLAYWTAATGAVSALPADARLLGQLDGAARRFATPDGAGQVVFFSLAHGEVVANWRPEGR